MLIILYWKNSWLIITIIYAHVYESPGQLRFGWFMLHLTVGFASGCGLSGLRFRFFAPHVFILWSRQKGQQLSRARFSHGESPEYKSRAKPYKHIYDFCFHYSHENSTGQVKWSGQAQSHWGGESAFHSQWKGDRSEYLLNSNLNDHITKKPWPPNFC